MQENEGVGIPALATVAAARRCEYGVDICGPATVATLFAGRTGARLLFVARTMPLGCSFSGWTVGLRPSDARAFDIPG